MLAPSIKSRPVYGRLTPRAGLLQVFVADGDGAQAILDVRDRAPEGFFERASLVVVGASLEASAALESLQPQALVHVATVEAALERLADILATARMGTRLYLAGTEALIGQAMTAALDAGLEGGAIETEHRGSARRRVQCVHCKGFTDDVTTQPTTCSHCGLTLFVRDHYSRRLAAFQGVCIDAEEPGVRPAAEVVFP